MNKDELNICQVSLNRDIALIEENLTNFKKIYKKDKFLYFNAEDKLCMYSSSPCTNIPVHPSIDLKKKFGYKVYYLDLK